MERASAGTVAPPTSAPPRPAAIARDSRLLCRTPRHGRGGAAPPRPRPARRGAAGGGCGALSGNAMSAECAAPRARWRLTGPSPACRGHVCGVGGQRRLQPRPFAPACGHRQSKEFHSAAGEGPELSAGRQPVMFSGPGGRLPTQGEAIVRGPGNGGDPYGVQLKERDKPPTDIDYLSVSEPGPALKSFQGTQAPAVSNSTATRGAGDTA